MACPSAYLYPSVCPSSTARRRRRRLLRCKCTRRTIIGERERVRSLGGDRPPLNRSVINCRGLRAAGGGRRASAGIEERNTIDGVNNIQSAYHYFIRLLHNIKTSTASLAIFSSSRIICLTQHLPYALFIRV